MPRSPNTYSLPPGTTPQQPNQIISSSMFNAFADDVAQTFNTVQPVVYGGTGTNDLKLSDADFGIKDSVDPTKIAQFDVSGQPTGVTRTFNTPYYSGTLGLVSDIRGQIYGLTLSNNVTDATNDIDIAAGSAVDSTGAVSMLLATALGKRLDAAWAVGGTPASPNGGLDTGAVANTTYHVFLIRRPDTGVVDALFSTSPTSPTLPANYTQFRRIGSFYRVAGVNVAFTQRGDEFLLKAIVVDQNASTFSTTPTNIQLSLPSGVQFDAIVNLSCQQAALRYVLIYSPDQTDITASSSNFTIFNLAGTYGYGYGRIRTNTSGQIRAVASGASTQIQVTTMGWYDSRGQFG